MLRQLFELKELQGKTIKSAVEADVGEFIVLLMDDDTYVAFCIERYGCEYQEVGVYQHPFHKQCPATAAELGLIDQKELDAMKAEEHRVQRHRDLATLRQLKKRYES